MSRPTLPSSTTPPSSGTTAWERYLTALLGRDLRIIGLVEHDSVPWDALPGQMERLEMGEFRLADRPWRLAHSYTLQAIRAGAR